MPITEKSNVLTELDKSPNYLGHALGWIDKVEDFSKTSREDLTGKPYEGQRVILSYLIGQGDYLVYKLKSENINLNPVGLDLKTLEANLFFLKEHQRLIFEPMISEQEASEILSMFSDKNAS